MYWRYIALTRSAQEVTASLAGSKEDVLRHLSNQQLCVIEIKPDYKRIFLSALPRRKLSALSLAIFFEDFSNMLETGMNVPQVLLIFKETAKEELGSVLLMLEEKIHQGHSLTKSLADLNIFPWIVSTTLLAGERTGRLAGSMNILGKYFRNSYRIQNKMQQILVYPAVVFVVLLVVMLFISLKVIPQLKNLLPTEALHNQITQCVLTGSFLLQQYAWAFVVLIILVFLGVYYFKDKYRYSFQQWLYGWPILGNIVKESTIALYLLNLSVLLKSGVSLLKSLEDLNISEQTPVSKHFLESREYVLGGSSFWQALDQDKFFPAIIPSTFRRAEEMVKVDDYCLSLSEFFDRRVNAKVDGLLQFVQPALLALGGGFLVVIALGFLLPIYGSLTTIATGQ